MLENIFEQKEFQHNTIKTVKECNNSLTKCLMEGFSKITLALQLLIHKKDM